MGGGPPPYTRERMGLARCVAPVLCKCVCVCGGRKKGVRALEGRCSLSLTRVLLSPNVSAPR